jgi:hypothetical protein
MLVTPKKGTACLTLTLVLVAMVMVHLNRIAAYRNASRNCYGILTLTVRVRSLNA